MSVAWLLDAEMPRTSTGFFRAAEMFRQLVSSAERGPLRFDLDHAKLTGGVVPKARPRPVFRFLHESALDRIAMDVADHFGAGFLSVDIPVVVALLPELLARSSQLARSHLLDGLQQLRKQNPRRLIDEQMDMLGHENVGINSRQMPCARLFQHCLDRLLRSRRFQQREPVKTTERNEMQRFRCLESFQAARHELILIPSRPLIAKNAMNGAQILGRLRFS